MSSKNQKSLESIDFDHRKEKFDENLEDEKTSEIKDTNQIFTLEEASVNLMSQQVMILLRNHDYKVSQLIDHRWDLSITSKQNSIDLMTQHKIEDIYSVDNTKSSKLKVLLEEKS